MQSSSSSIPVVTDALVDLLNGLAWPGAAPQILDGELEEPKRECVIVGDTFEGSSAQDWMTFGRSRMEEYDLRLRIQVATPGLKVKPARDRAFDLFAAIESALAADPSLGIDSTTGRTILVGAIQQPEHQQGATDEGCVCVIHSALRVRAQINPASGD